MSFARALMTVSGLTMLSRVAGFLRDVMTAAFLGAGPIADAFFVALRLPNLFRSLFAEGAFSAAFVPLYTAEKNKGGDHAKLFAGEALAVLLCFLLPFIVLMIMAMPYVIQFLAPGFATNSTSFTLAVHYGQITFPYLLLISVTALQGSILNAHGRFGPSAATPIAFNLILIAALSAAYYYKWDIGQSLAISVTIAGFAQMLWLAWSCHQARIALPLTLPKLRQPTRDLFRRLGPGAIGAGAGQINLVISTILASTLPSGAISYLFYADRLHQLPLGVIGIAVATTLLPILSDHIEKGSENKVRHTISRALEFSLLLGIPATLGLMLAAAPIIEVLFERGAFGQTETHEAARALMAYAAGIPAFLFIKVFASSFYARHDTATPVKIAFFSMVVNVALAYLFLDHLQHVGIALANALANWANALILFVILRQRKYLLLDDPFAGRVQKILGAGFVYGMTLATAPVFAATAFMPKLFALLAIIGVPAVFYALIIHGTGVVRWQELQNKFTTKKPLTTDDDVAP
jgi:putative peptidoglycan lipid II flippase